MGQSAYTRYNGRKNGLTCFVTCTDFLWSKDRIPPIGEAPYNLFFVIANT